MGVRDEDRGAARAHGGELETQLGGVAARVDDDRVGRAAPGADDVAVRLDRPERELFDRERHGLRVYPGAMRFLRPCDGGI